MARVVPAAGAILQRIVATAPLVAYRGLSREAFVKYDAAQAKTAWALRHRRRFALMQADDVLASAERYDLTGRRVLRGGRLKKMSARDAARLLGLSHQRVHQLTQAASEKR